MIDKRTFEQAFNAVFHDKSDFQDFCSFDVSNEIETFTVSKRVIFKTSDKLKQYLRFLDRVILRYLAKDHDVVHSFTKGKNTLTAVQAHSANTYFFQTDIESYYPNIKNEDVLRLLKRDRHLIPISDIDAYLDRLTEMMTYGNSIPIGFSTSPQLSNAFLYEFDQGVKSYCLDRDLIYTRYADDIVISGKEIESVAELRNIIQRLLEEKASPSLKLKKEKTHITHLGNKVKILGLNILPNGQVTIDAKYKKKLELLLYFYATDEEKYKSYLEQEFKGSEQSLFGMLHYVKSVDSAYIEKLQRKYGAYAIRTLMVDKWNDQR